MFFEPDLEMFIEAGKRIAEENLVKCSSGNLSCRDDDQFLISASGAWLGRLYPKAIVLCDSDGKSKDDIKPSSELKLHLEIYKNRPDINVVLHCQSFYATLISCSNCPIMNFKNFIPEIPFYIDNIGRIDYYTPGSKELAENVSKCSLINDAILMRNHGQIIIGKHFDEVIQKAVFLEFACKFLIKTEKHLVFYNLTTDQEKEMKNYRKIKGE